MPSKRTLKLWQKYAKMFQSNHGFAPPFMFIGKFSSNLKSHIIVDGAYLHYACKSHTNLTKHANKIFEGEVRMCVTNCIIEELKSMGEK